MQTKSLPTRSFSSIVAPVILVTALAFSTLTVQGQTKTQGRVDVNSADVKTLETLPGIGSTLANRIVAGRPYHSVDDLAKVKGLSKSKIDAIQDKITFGSGTTTTKKSATKSSKKTTTPETSATDTSGSPRTKSSSKSTTASESSGSKTVPPTGSSTGKLAPGQTININTATAEQLDALPGIGPTKAQAIIDYRNEHGRFDSIEDIQNVKGIKEGEFSKIKDYIRVR
jgi:competence protein ComEA